MSDFLITELEAAHMALLSSYNKIEKTLVTLSKKQPPPKAQLTLAARNLEALRIALSLVTGELTKTKTNDTAPDTETTDADRLAAFESVYKELDKNIAAIPAELDKLKAEGKEKSARYRELFGQKMMNIQITALFERYGFYFG